MRRLLRPLWVLLALIFLIEAWLWERLEPVVAWVVERIPLRAIKEWFADKIDHLSPGATLIVSDYGISGETGKGTDFVVLTK